MATLTQIGQRISIGKESCVVLLLRRSNVSLMSCSFCSVLDDNKILTLPSGERLGIPSNIRIILEVRRWAGCPFVPNYMLTSGFAICIIG